LPLTCVARSLHPSALSIQFFAMAHLVEDEQSSNCKALGSPKNHLKLGHE
jgi:hypothetical protein